MGVVYDCLRVLPAAAELGFEPALLLGDCAVRAQGQMTTEWGSSLPRCPARVITKGTGSPLGVDGSSGAEEAGLGLQVLGQL